MNVESEAWLFAIRCDAELFPFYIDNIYKIIIIIILIYSRYDY